jgi:hypothetical protein
MEGMEVYLVEIFDKLLIRRHRDRLSGSTMC